MPDTPVIPAEILEALQERPRIQLRYPFTRFILWSCILVFAAQIFFEKFLHSDALSYIFAASSPGLRAGMLWQIVTYAWLHSVELPIHILFNLFMIYPLGREIERTLGTARTAVIYLGSVVSGALAFFIFSDDGTQLIAGASAAAFGLLTSIALLYPNRKLDVLLFFVIPLRLKLKTLALLVCGIEVFFQVFGILAFISHSAHLGGALAGLIITLLIKPKFTPRQIVFPAGF